MLDFELSNVLEMHDHYVEFEDVVPYGDLFRTDSPQIVDRYVALEHTEQ